MNICGTEDTKSQTEDANAFHFASSRIELDTACRSEDKDLEQAQNARSQKWS